MIHRLALASCFALAGLRLRPIRWARGLARPLPRALHRSESLGFSEADVYSSSKPGVLEPLESLTFKQCWTRLYLCCLAEVKGRSRLVQNNFAVLEDKPVPPRPGPKSFGRV